MTIETSVKCDGCGEARYVDKVDKFYEVMCHGRADGKAVQYKPNHFCSPKCLERYYARGDGAVE